MRKSSRMAPKEKQTIEIEKTDRDPLLSFNQAVTVDCSDFLGTALLWIRCPSLDKHSDKWDSIRVQPRYRGLSERWIKETPVFSRSLTGGLTVRKNRYPIDHACLLEPFQYGDRNL